MTSDEPNEHRTTDEYRDWWSEAKELVSTRAYRRGQVIHAGVVLGVFDPIDESMRPVHVIAQELELDPNRTYRLLRALAAIGVLHMDDERRFAISSLGAPFQSDHPRSLVDSVRLSNGPELVSTMQHLPAVVRGGPDGFVREYGCTFYEYADRNPAFGDAFHSAMSQPSSEGDPVLDAFDADELESVTHVCDVGGSKGRFLCAFLREYPHIEGTVYDLPTAVEGAARLADSMGVAERCSYVAGDMFEAVPEADSYIFKGIVGNWTDEECEMVLSNVHRAATADARLFVVQRILSDTGPTERNAIGDISQLVYFGGRHRTETEFQTLLASTGWELSDVRPVEGKVSSVLVGRKRVR